MKSLKKTRTKGKKTKMYIKKCNPRNYKNNKNNTCFSKNSLIKIIDKWNSENESKIHYNKNDTITILWNKLDEKLNNVCNDEWCWSRLPFIKSLNDKELNSTFRPKMPKSWYKNTREWLSTTDINNVLKQYQEAYNDFKYIGAIPIDFDSKDNFGTCIVEEMCKLDIKNMLNKNINKIAVIFNLDKHDEPGSHWVALFISLHKNEIYFFDSYGVNPPKEVRVLMNRLKEQGKKLNRDISLYYNNIRHQYKNSECGVYSINFIVNLLENESYQDLIKNKISDDDMNNNRNFYFIKE